MPTPTIDWNAMGAQSSNDSSSDEFTWKAAAPGDTLTGTLISVKEVTTRYGAKVVLNLASCSEITVNGDAVKAKDATVWPTQGLLNALGEAEAQKGDEVTITLVDLIDTGKGNPFKAFTVAKS